MRSQKNKNIKYFRYNAKRKKGNKTVVTNNNIDVVICDASTKHNIDDDTCITRQCYGGDGDCRDDDCVILEMIDVREDIKDNIRLTRNKISIEDSNICLNFNGDYFKFIDVAGDGDCFHRSILKSNTILEKFNGVQELRIYLRDRVNHLFFHIKCYNIYSLIIE